MTRRPISAKTRYLILERDKFTCQCCGSTAPNVTLHVDHIIAVANEGSDHPDNLRAVCITCNVGKGALDPNVTSIGQVNPSYPIKTANNEVRNLGESLTEPVFWIGKEWAVTAHGVEARDGRYVIEAKRLWESPDWPWEKHMAEKGWVDMDDFRAAITWARNHFASLKKSA